MNNFAIIFQSIFISRVTEEGPAGQAGIQVGDKLLAVSIQQNLFITLILGTGKLVIQIVLYRD